MLIRVPSGPWTDFTRQAIERLLRQTTSPRSANVANVPPAAENTGSWLYVPDESGGAVMAFSDGTDWRRCTDRAVIS